MGNWTDDVSKGRADGAGTVRVQAFLTPGRIDKLDRVAAANGLSRSAVLRWLIDRMEE